MLAVLQHHGVPTRLIDVTSNPMTALWFAAEQHKPDDDGAVRRSPGVLFAFDVTKTRWYETFQHGEDQTFDHLENPLAASTSTRWPDHGMRRRCFGHSQPSLTSG